MASEEVDYNYVVTCHLVICLPPTDQSGCLIQCSCVLSSGGFHGSCGKGSSHPGGSTICSGGSRSKGHLVDISYHN